MYSNSCSFKPELIKIDQSSHKMYSNNILYFQESTPILNVWKPIECTTYIYIYIYIINIKLLIGLVWFGVYVQWHINFRLLFNAKAIFVELRKYYKTFIKVGVMFFSSVFVQK